jgi:hypothetical protein
MEKTAEEITMERTIENYKAQLDLLKGTIKGIRGKN